ncbi:hypothetical protein QYF36_019443 [Acer negundo]|nr:hypothetical protein QYF36_019443 [Acer negundo]
MVHRSNECPKRRTDALVNLVENDDGERAIWEDEIQHEEDQSNDEEEKGIEELEDLGFEDSTLWHLLVPLLLRFMQEDNTYHVLS